MAIFSHNPGYGLIKREGRREVKNREENERGEKMREERKWNERGKKMKDESNG